MLPLVLVATPLLFLVSPLLLVGTAGVDAFTNPRRWRWSRLLAMSLNYLALEWVGIVVAAGLWVVSGFGRLIGRRWSQQLHHRMQLWWVTQLFGAIERWLGAALDVDGGDELSDGPVVIIARHSSFFDAVVPAVAVGRVTTDMHLRHLLKRELAWSPCLDLYGNRLHNHFVDRMPRDRSAELDAVGLLGHDLGTDAVVIFPEGTFRSPRRAERELARVAERDPARHEVVAALKHHLPVRPGGILAILDAAEGADLVFLTHTGFEPFGSFKEIFANVPFHRPIQAQAWRVPADDVPDNDDDRLAYLDDWWQRMDDWVAAHQ